jgi:hypothetical protein
MISPETVMDVVERVSSIPHELAPALATEMASEQPSVLAYLLAMSEDESLDREEGQVIVYVGMVLWQVTKQVPAYQRKVTEEDMDAAEKANEDFLKRLSSDSAGDFVGASQSMVEDYPEPAVLRYVVEALMEDDEGNTENPPIREENIGLAFFHLKVVLDALIGAKT